MPAMIPSPPTREARCFARPWRQVCNLPPAARHRRSSLACSAQPPRFLVSMNSLPSVSTHIARCGG
ncbi:MAG: hypothetical protein O2946_12540, partial [Planctomycetota bacterium]|nr:hypothetical protein [Planctomycetota bacterium]